MEVFDKVRYLGKPAYVVGKRQPKRDEIGCFYDLCRSPNSAKPDFKNIPEKYLTGSDVCVASNGWAMRV